MSHVILQQQQQQRPEFRRPTFRLNVGPLTTVIIMMVLIGIMGLISLTHLNAMSTKGYVINKLEDEQQGLVEDGEINDMLILNARSMKTIEDHQLVQNMVKPSQIYYLESVTGLASAN